MQIIRYKNFLQVDGLFMGFAASNQTSFVCDTFVVSVFFEKEKGPRSRTPLFQSWIQYSIGC